MACDKGFGKKTKNKHPFKFEFHHRYQIALGYLFPTLFKLHFFCFNFLHFWISYFFISYIFNLLLFFISYFFQFTTLCEFLLFLSYFFWFPTISDFLFFLISSFSDFLLFFWFPTFSDFLLFLISFWSGLIWTGSGAVLSCLVWSVQLNAGRELTSYRGDTKTMTLSEDKGHGKNVFFKTCCKGKPI